jgi:hypothetical protein
MAWFKKPDGYNGWFALWCFFMCGFTGEQWFSQHQSWWQIAIPLSWLFCGIANVAVDTIIAKRNKELVKRRDELRAELDAHFEAVRKALDEHDEPGADRRSYRN